MSKNSTQVKILIRKRSSGDSNKAQALLRIYAMERFLERVSLSEYRERIILKGGALISSMIGIDMRSTMDIDTNLKGVSLNESDIYTMIQNIIGIELDDQVSFELVNLKQIMDGADYPGIRVSMRFGLDGMKVPFKIDFSTGDVVTPREIRYDYSLMFEDRSITIMAYNSETLIAEKFETALSRGVANTRMRDFYDMYMLQSVGHPISKKHLSDAITNTCKWRGSLKFLEDSERILSELNNSNIMQELWSDYQTKFEYARDISWEEIIESINKIRVLISE